MKENREEESNEKQLEEHKKWHRKAHLYLDTLIADWLSCTEELPSEASVLTLMQWSAKQMTNPDQPRQ